MIPGLNSCGGGIVGDLMHADYDNARRDAYDRGFQHGRNDRIRAKGFQPGLRDGSVRDSLRDEYRRGYRLGYGRR